MIVLRMKSRNTVPAKRNLEMWKPIPYAERTYSSFLSPRRYEDQAQGYHFLSFSKELHQGVVPYYNNRGNRGDAIHNQRSETYFKHLIRANGMLTKRSAGRCSHPRKRSFKIRGYLVKPSMRDPCSTYTSIKCICCRVLVVVAQIHKVAIVLRIPLSTFFLDLYCSL